MKSWFYRGGWHQPCPLLSCGTLYIPPQPTLLGMALRLAPSRISRIVEVSRLLHLVRLLSLSQYNSPGSCSHSRYRSKPRWAVTPPSSVIGRSVIPWRRTISMGARFQGIPDIPDYPQFPGVIRVHGVDSLRVTEPYARWTNHL